MNASMYATKLLLCCLLLHLLILPVLCNGHESTGHEIPNHRRRLHDHRNTHAVTRIEQVHSSHIDPAALVFFFPEDLKLGNTMPVYFPKRKLSDSLSRLLSKNKSDSIPFSSRQLGRLLRLFSFPPDSPQATAMRETLEECEREAIEGETKFCATSLESMSEFLQTIFGSNVPIEPLSTTHIGDSDRALLQEYRIVGIERIPAPKMVSCHTMPYAYTVFYCHYQEGENRVYRVALTGDDGGEVEAVAVCHMDTSHWGRSHVAFEVLGVEPGTTPACHFFPGDNFVWVPSIKA